MHVFTPFLSKVSRALRGWKALLQLRAHVLVENCLTPVRILQHVLSKILHSLKVGGLQICTGEVGRLQICLPERGLVQIRLFERGTHQQGALQILSHQ
jgi:hypothetical protein